MLKIIHLLDTLRFGGAESVALNYARLLAAECGAESTLCGRPESADFERFAEKYVSLAPRFSRQAVRRADVIFVHSNRNLLKVFLLRLFSKHPRRIVYVQHLRYGKWKFWLLSVLINRVCTDFIRITPVTEQLVNQFIKIPVAFIPNFYLPRYAPHERAAIRQAVRRDLNLFDGQELVLFSGALRAGKGLEDFLTLAGLYVGDESRRFVVVGDGPQAAKIRAYPHENVLWTGWQADVERFLLAADAYVFPAAREMMPMALVEALTLGVPAWAAPSPAGDFLLDSPTDAASAAAKTLKEMLRKRILHVQVLPKLTGVQRVSLEIFRSLPDGEYEKTILFGGPVNPQTADCVEKFREAGCKILFFSELKREIGWHDWKAFGKIYRLCRRERFDIVHTHSTKPGIVGRIAARLAGVRRVVHTVHGVAFHPYETRWKRAFYHFAEQFASLFSHRIALVSNYYKKHFRLFGRKLRIVHNGIAFPDEAPGAAQFGGGPIRLLFVGRLEAAKDPLTLLRAAAILHGRARTDFRLTVVGDGSLEAECQEFVQKNGLSGTVDFVGWQGDVTPFYEKHQIFCLSSIHESFGICLLEAGAQGLPAVATRVGGVPEVIRDGVTGLLVPPRNPEKMADAIEKLAEDPALRRRMGRAAATHVREHFPAGAMIEAYKGLYNSKL